MPEDNLNSGLHLRDVRFQARHARRLLCVFPRYSPSFGTFQHAFPLIPGVRAFMPPQGLLLAAALAPKGWQVRFVDENIRPVTEQEWLWADIVFLSGMHIQRTHIHDLTRRAHRHHKTVVLGGPSASAAPQWYPDADCLHCGEAGDATAELFRRLDDDPDRPPHQLRFRTLRRLPLTEFPSPAYHLLDIHHYLLGSIQFSSGCPFTCEFCDIPSLYGRNPRFKSPPQVLAELDALADGGAVSIYFVDDNFIGNPRAARELLPHLVRWQQQRDYQVRLSCEATLNLAGHPDILQLMRDAFFTNCFFGVETPEPGALRAIRKTQNLRSPLLEAVDTFHRYGIEPAAGIIMGLDTDTAHTPQAIIDFAQATAIPILTVNLLYALPGTPLYQRLEAEGRLVNDAGRDSNVDFLQPYEDVVAGWRHVVRTLYEPSALYRRYATLAARTYPHRARPRHPLSQLKPANLRRFLGVSLRLLCQVGLRAGYRAEFWRMAWRQLQLGNIETIIQIALVAHHLITYARECARHRMQASHYSARHPAATTPASR